MYPGLPSRLEKEMKQLYMSRVLNGNPERLNVRFRPFLLLIPPFSSISLRGDFPRANRSFVNAFFPSTEIQD